MQSTPHGHLKLPYAPDSICLPVEFAGAKGEDWLDPLFPCLAQVWPSQFFRQPTDLKQGFRGDAACEASRGERVCMSHLRLYISDSDILSQVPDSRP